MGRRGLGPRRLLGPQRGTTVTMRRPPLVLLLFLYVALDFSNPLMPGAVNFGAEESVEGVRAERRLAPDLPDVRPATPAPEPAAPAVEPADARPPGPRPVRVTWLPASRRTPVHARDAAPPGDDD